MAFAELSIVPISARKTCKTFSPRVLQAATTIRDHVTGPTEATIGVFGKMKEFEIRFQNRASYSDTSTP